MAYNRRSGGGGGYGGYGSGGGGGRYNGGGGYRAGAAGTVNPWQSGSVGPMSRQPQQGGPPPAQLAMASNIISKLLTSSNSMAGGGYGSPNRSANWGNSGPRMSHMGMRRQEGPGTFNKDNRRRGGDPHRFSGRKTTGGPKDAEKRKSTGKVNDENKKGQNERERTKEQLDADKKASYVGVPSAVLYCHVCSKHMWDSESFEKHVRGRPHELMMTYLDEAYRMRVDFMRHQIKAVENQREIDLERVTNNKHKSNTGNKNSGGNANASKPLLRSYCPMCDVRFYGPLTGHRKSDRHRKLKQFLHPECKLCDALFHTRLEMDEHKLTSGHLRKVAVLRNVEHPHLKDDEFDLIDMIKIEEEEQQDHDQIPVAKKYEMLGDRDATKLKLELEGGSNEKHRNEKKNSSISETNVAADAATTADEEKIVDEDNELKDEDKMETSDIVAEAEESAEDGTLNQSIKDENSKLDSSGVKDNLVAAYDPNVAIGKELLIDSKGFVCRLCNCFLIDEQRVSIHCQTAAHYINYTTMTKMKEAAAGGNKKRGIEQLDDDNSEKTEAKENENGVVKPDEAEKEPETITNAEEPAVKRIKLEETVLEIAKIEVETKEVMDTNEIKEEVKEVLPETVKVVAPPVVEEKPAEVAAPVAPPVAPPTPTRGRGGGRGRGGRGGVARRGVRR